LVPFLADYVPREVPHDKKKVKSFSEFHKCKGKLPMEIFSIQNMWEEREESRRKFADTNWSV
jgi:hypothetical protein